MDKVKPVIFMMTTESVKLAPSQSTVYVSNIPFNLTNNDLHKLGVNFDAENKYDVCFCPFELIR